MENALERRGQVTKDNHGNIIIRTDVNKTLQIILKGLQRLRGGKQMQENKSSPKIKSKVVLD